MLAKNSKKKGKKAQGAGSSAILLLVITVLIVLYILFLPPEDREALLSNYSTNGSTSSGKVVLRESPGALAYLSDNEKEYDFPTFTINTEVKGEVLKTKSSMYVKNSAFQKIEEDFTFNVADPGLTDNVVLSFNSDIAEGILHVTFNGETILNAELQKGNSPPIVLDASRVQKDNVIHFSVSGPGLAFWSYNQYSLSNIKVTADVKDVSESESIQTFNLPEKEITNMEKSKLRYVPVCKTKQIKNLEVQLNGVTLFRGTPDCDVFNFQDVSKTMLKAGSNQLKFKIDEGAVLIDMLRLTNYLDQAKEYTYYFEIDEYNFTNPDGNYSLNSNLDVYLDMVFPNTDQKKFELFINGKKMAFNTAKIKESRLIDTYVRPGTNSIEIRPLKDMTMTELKVRIKTI